MMLVITIHEGGSNNEPFPQQLLRPSWSVININYFSHLPRMEVVSSNCVFQNQDKWSSFANNNKFNANGGGGNEYKWQY